MIPSSHIKALREICARLEDKGIQWVVTGSLNMAMQGMPVAVHDIDLQTNEAGAYEMEALFLEYVVTPLRYLESEHMRSHLGKLLIDGVEVEIIGGLQKLLPDGTWEAPVEVVTHRCYVEVNSMWVPVLSLAYEYQAYLIMGRLEKADMIKKRLEMKD